MSAPVMWVIVDPRGRLLGPVFDDEDDAISDCLNRNERINALSGMVGRYCRAKPVAFIKSEIIQ